MRRHGRDAALKLLLLLGHVMVWAAAETRTCIRHKPLWPLVPIWMLAWLPSRFAFCALYKALVEQGT